MSHILAIAETAIRQYFKPAKDPVYLRFIRRFPCVACGKSKRIEAAHIGPRGLGEKTDDCTCLPLCFLCHQDGPRSLHRIGPVDFQAVHGLDFAVLIGMFNHFYFLKTGAWAKGWEREERRKAA